MQKTEEQMNKELLETAATRNAAEYGRDGFIMASEESFTYKGITYLIKTLRYYHLDTILPEASEFLPMGKRTCEYHAVVEHGPELDELADFIKEEGFYYDFLYHDTLHSWNDKQSLEEQIEEMKDLARSDIDQMGHYLNKVEEKLKEKQEKLANFRKMVSA